MINLRILRWEDSPDEPDVITRVLMRRRQEATDTQGHRERFEGPRLMVLKREGAATGTLWKLEEARK